MDTKARITPNIPFRIVFNGSNIDVNSITIYHPCPLRINDKQADAVISLNDPSDSYLPSGDGKNPSAVILIPIMAGDPTAPSAVFFNRIASHIPDIADADFMTGLFPELDIPTGNDWSVSQLFPPKKPSEGCGDIVSPGYFVWRGVPEQERYFEGRVPATSANIGKNKWIQGFINAWFLYDTYVNIYKWKQKSDPAPTYIMMEKPLPVGAADLATLLNTLPVTKWDIAIHPILQVNEKPWVVYKQGPPDKCEVPMREEGGDVREGYANKCDPFYNNAISTRTEFTADKLFTMFFNVMVMVAIAIGAYIALAAVARMMDVNYADFAKGAGKVIGVWAKKLGDMQMPGGLTALAGKAGLGALAGKAGMGDLGALAGKGGLGDLAGKGGLGALAGKGGLGDLAGKGGLGDLAGKGGLGALGDLAGKGGLGDIASSASVMPAIEGLSGQTPNMASEPASSSTSKKWDKVSTPYLGKTGFTRRGGRTRRDRDHGGLTQRDSH
jgi:hypothetical protein